MVRDNRQQIRQLHRLPEREILAALLAELELDDDDILAIDIRAKLWVQQARGPSRVLQPEFWLQGISLSAPAGLAAMRLAESLLRTPDAKTANALLADKLPGRFWPDIVCKLLRPTLSFGMAGLGRHYVLAESIEQALAMPVVSGHCYSFDMLGEGARTAADAERYCRRYREAIASLRDSDSHSVSIKLSALHPRYELHQHRRIAEELLPRLKSLALLARDCDVALCIDAEESERLELSLDLLQGLFSDNDLAGWSGLGMAVQAYQKRAPAVIDWLCRQAQCRGVKIPLRLVKGAYWDREIRQAQLAGFIDYPVFTDKFATDVSYLLCAQKCLHNREFLYPQFASHNAHTLAAVLELDRCSSTPSQRRQGFEFQRLQGMGGQLHRLLHRDTGLTVRTYAPIGRRCDLLAYLVRRLLENGANSSFVHGLHNSRVLAADLIADPIAPLQRQLRGEQTPSISLPADLYRRQRRENSSAVDLQDVDTACAVECRLQRRIATQYCEQPPAEGVSALYSPVNRRLYIGSAAMAGEEEAVTQLAAVAAGFSGWSRRSTSQRGKCLLRLAESLERRREHCVYLLLVEGAKTIVDALAEVREAVDFCRYYAAEALQLDSEHFQPRGVLLCISPWNFPLAIFIGQISAALVAGNTVLAKPSAQGALVARFVVGLMRESGLDESVVALVAGRGADVARWLLSDPRLHGVIFTGSCDSARSIARHLAQRREPELLLIAETGGQNAMIVDSSALLEQVIDDVLQSAFGAAGQRCSALRVLYVQDDIADALIELLAGAMAELVLGPPWRLASDIGPLIDELACERLRQHESQLVSQGAVLLYRCSLPSCCRHGNFVSPSLYEIDDINQLGSEVFAPLLHLRRFRSGTLDAVVDEINSWGYGLTLGLHSRLDSAADRVVARCQVGNIYINRSMVGAVVGVQPFGGRRLSGTGPKAGGPLYLPRLLKPRDVNGLQDDIGSRLQALGQCDVAAMVAARLMPGPTGESNRVLLEPRGCLAVLVGSEQSTAAVVQALVAISLTANRAVLFCDVEDRCARVCSALGDIETPPCLPLSELPVQVRAGRLAGLVLAANSRSAPKMRRVLLSNSDGALLPLLPMPVDASAATARYFLQSLMLEKTVSVDTTAAGGNIELLNAGYLP